MYVLYSLLLYNNIFMIFYYYHGKKMKNYFAIKFFLLPLVEAPLHSNNLFSSGTFKVLGFLSFNNETEISPQEAMHSSAAAVKIFMFVWARLPQL